MINSIALYFLLIILRFWTFYSENFVILFKVLCIFKVLCLNIKTFPKWWYWVSGSFTHDKLTKFNKLFFYCLAIHFFLNHFFQHTLMKYSSLESIWYLKTIYVYMARLENIAIVIFLTFLTEILREYFFWV